MYILVVGGNVELIFPLSQHSISFLTDDVDVTVEYAGGRTTPRDEHRGQLGPGTDRPGRQRPVAVPVVIIIGGGLRIESLHDINSIAVLQNGTSAHVDRSVERHHRWRCDGLIGTGFSSISPVIHSSVQCSLSNPSSLKSKTSVLKAM